MIDRTARAAIAKYGRDVCLEAFALSERGWGANSISYEIAGLRSGCTNQADAAINAGRKLSQGE